MNWQLATKFDWLGLGVFGWFLFHHHLLASRLIRSEKRILVCVAPDFGIIGNSLNRRQYTLEVTQKNQVCGSYGTASLREMNQSTTRWRMNG